MWRVVLAGFDREDPWAADPERPPSLCPSVCRESEKGLRKRLPSARERAREAFATYVEGGLCRFRSRGPVGR